MLRYLVSGGNKGIGRALCERLLSNDPRAFVYLGSRDEARGGEAVAALTAVDASWGARLRVVTLDVCSAESVARAVRELGDEPLAGLVNNAGVWVREDSALTFEVNVFGAARLTAACRHLLPTGSRVVMISSGAAPMFVAKCTPARQAALCEVLSVAAVEASAREFLAALAADTADGGGRLTAMGYPQPDPQQGAYGASKAFMSQLTLAVASEMAGVLVNACSPGMIDTDMVRPLFAASGKTPAESGALTPAQGTRAPMHLLFGEVGSGLYFGSDALRSPLDRYRAPGTPAYEG